MAKRAHDSKERVNRKKNRRVVEGEDECKVILKLPVTLRVLTDKHSNRLFSLFKFVTVAKC